MNNNNKIYKHLMNHIEENSRVINTDKFAYTSFYPPNTTSTITDLCIEKMFELSPGALKLYLFMLNKLTRSTDPTLAITVNISHKDCDFLSRTSYFIKLKELRDSRLVLSTPKNNLHIVNVQFFNKLYKTKQVLE